MVLQNSNNIYIQQYILLSASKFLTESCPHVKGIADYMPEILLFLANLILGVSSGFIKLFTQMKCSLLQTKLLLENSMYYYIIKALAIVERRVHGRTLF